MGWPHERDDPQVRAALGWSCDICKAKAGELCTNTIRPGEELPGRLVHIGRLHDRRRK